MANEANTTQPSSSEIVTGPAANALREHHEVKQAKEAQPGFVDQVKGYAKEFAGKTFNKEHEQAQGEAVRKGEVKPEEAKSTITKESLQAGDSSGSSAAPGGAGATSADASNLRKNTSE